VIALNEQAFWSSEVAKMLGVQDVTVRSWALRLEKYGYTFMRDSNDKRAYTERDISVLRYLQSQVQDKKLKLDDAARITADRFKMENEQEECGIMGTAIAKQENTLESRYDALLRSHEALLTWMEETKNTQQGILERLERQEQRQEERDRALIQTMREMMEQRRIEADEKKSFWQRLLKK
jgi:DNA-binding transcriptional MerR regulator